jgi:hypothetical protein
MKTKQTKNNGSTIFLTSDAISSVQYDRATKNLRVTFRYGGTYQYDDISESTVGRLLGSESVGATFNTLFAKRQSKKVR